MEGKSNFFNIILLIIVAFLTLTIAALAGFVFLGGSNKPAATQAQAVDTSIPADDKLASIVLYEAKQYFNLKTSDTNTSSLPVIQVGVELKYYIKTPKGSSVKEPLKKVEAYEGEIKKLVGIYFMNLTLEEAKNPETRTKAEAILKKEFNELLNENESEKKDIIYAVTLNDWFYT